MLLQVIQQIAIKLPTLHARHAPHAHLHHVQEHCHRFAGVHCLDDHIRAHLHRETKSNALKTDHNKLMRGVDVDVVQCLDDHICVQCAHAPQTFHHSHAHTSYICMCASITMHALKATTVEVAPQSMPVHTTQFLLLPLSRGAPNRDLSCTRCCYPAPCLSYCLLPQFQQLPLKFFSKLLRDMRCAGLLPCTCYASAPCLCTCTPPATWHLLLQLSRSREVRDRDCSCCTLGCCPAQCSYQNAYCTSIQLLRPPKLSPINTVRAFGGFLQCCCTLIPKCGGQRLPHQSA